MRTRIKLILSVSAILGLAACSGGWPGSPKAASPTPNPRQQMVAFAQCMRDHGLGDLPDPSSSGEMHINSGPGSDLDPSSPAFQSAQTACKKYEPSGGGDKGKPDPQMMARMLHFAQ